MEEKVNNPLENIDLKKIFNLVWFQKIKILTFCFVITSLVLVYTISLPNDYKSYIIFEKEGKTSGKNSSVGLSTLAGLAGVSLGSNSENFIDKLKLILSDYDFNKSVVEKYNLHKLIDSQETINDYVFAMNIRKVYDLLNPSDNNNDEKQIRPTTKSISKIIRLTENKAGFMILEASHHSRKLAKKLVDIYLVELANELKKRDMKSLERKLNFYKKELQNTTSINLKTQLSNSISDLLKKKILADINELYLFDVVVKSRESFIEEKLGPKRAKFVITAFLFSLVLVFIGIIGIDYLKNGKKNITK